MAKARKQLLFQFPEFIDALGQMMPRLGIDSLGGEAGKRMSVALRPGGQLVGGLATPLLLGPPRFSSS